MSEVPTGQPRLRALATGSKRRARQARGLITDPKHPAETYTDALEAVDTERIEAAPAEPGPPTVEEPDADPTMGGGTGG